LGGDESLRGTGGFEVTLRRRIADGPIYEAGTLRQGEDWRALAPVMCALSLAVFLAGLDQTIVATAISAIARDLNDWSLLSWPVSAYLVACTAMTPVYGRLSDLYGRRPCLVATLGVFVAASILCALAQNMPELVGARVLQGVGGGGFWSVSHAVVADLVPPRERGRIQGWFAGASVTANLLGPILGGIFATYIGWRWIFWINVPLGSIALVLAYGALSHLPRPTRRPSVDWPGAALVVAATAAVVAAVTAAPECGWISIWTLLTLAVGAALTSVLLFREVRIAEPLLPPHLFGNPTFSLCGVLSFFAFAAGGGILVIAPLDFQAHGLSAAAAGLRLVPLTFGVALGSTAGALLVGRTGRYRVTLAVGALVAAAATAAFAWSGLASSAAAGGLMFALGIGFGGLTAPATMTVQNALAPSDVGVGLSCLIFFRYVGGAFGAALLCGVLARHGGLATAPSATAFPAAYVIAASMLAAAGVCALFLKEVPLRGRRL
jgi:EmrB/QacA subfamily drug resistance transporter